MFWILICVSVLLLGYGALSFMGGAMSDAPDIGNSEVNTGATMFLIGLVLVVLSFVARHFGWLPV